MSAFRYDDAGLQRLNALFRGPAPVVRVGILAGPKMARKVKTSKNDKATNAEIGAVQEFGSFTRKIPARSFLYAPLKSKKTREKIFKDAKEAFLRSIPLGGESADSFLGKIGAGLVAVVQDSFDQSGPGWNPLAASTIRRRQTRKIAPRFGDKPLIDTAQLRHSISFKILGDR